MKIIKADAMGLCFGVRDALSHAKRIDRPGEVTILGELAHNEQLLVQLQSRGFSMQRESNRDAVPTTPQVMVTAHGISQRERRRLQRAGKHLIDTTCPLVTRVHEAARELERCGYHVLVLGKPDHVEVQGIIGDLQRYDVISSEREVRQFAADKLGMICQTTMPLCEVQKIRRAVEKQNSHAEIRFLDTVCQPTKDRQAAARRLVSQVQAVVVVGGRNSNNTRRLAEYCRGRGLPTFHVQGAGDLQSEWFAGVERVGLTAGTSTLPETIAAVHARLAEISRDLDRGSRAWQAPHGEISAVQTPWTSAQWRKYFEQNGRNLLSIPWEQGVGLSDDERNCIARSVQEFQLGESGEGRHFLRCANEYARRSGDGEYVAALELFIREEQRHAQTLGRFMESAGIPKIKKNATDKVFRKLRHAAGLDLTISVLLTAEIIAKVYYRALRDATGSPLLRTLCAQILRDEAAHVRFQAERLALLRREWLDWKYASARFLQRLLFDGTSLVVWLNHRPALRAGGYSFRRFRRACRREFQAAMRMMDVCRCCGGC